MPRTPGVDGRQQALAAAARLFYERGVDTVSVDQVAEAAGLTKRAVYYHFPTKDDLVHAWLRAAGPPTFALLKAAADAARSTDPHPVGRLLDTLGRWMRRSDFHGCAFLNTARDRPADPTVLGIARDAKAGMRDWFVEIARAEHAPDPLLRARQYLLLVDALLATSHLYPAEELIATAKATLAGILATPNRRPATHRKGADR